ncbi:MAG TPA: hypothetical protein VHO48_01970 [Anaerolineaceae bacterium]|nr:hypothetical protein [Anaerolineaceae bacterium]
MKTRIALALLILALGLSACNMPQTTAPTPDEKELATQISQILTQMPTSTQGVITLPTAAVNTPENAQPTMPPTAAVTPTATLEATPTQEPTPTVTAAATIAPSLTPPATDPKLQLGEPTWRDTMDEGRNWPLDDDDFTSVDVNNGALVMTAVGDLDGWRLSVPTTKDAYMEASVKTGTCSGTDHYGIIFRVPNKTKADAGYLFGFTCDGQYSLRKWDGKTMSWLVKWTASQNILTGSNQTNRMGIMAVGSQMALYANGNLLTTVQDGSYSEGSFGMFVGSDVTDDFTIYVDEMAYWNK